MIGLVLSKQQNEISGKTAPRFYPYLYQICLESLAFSNGYKVAIASSPFVGGPEKKAFHK